MDFGAALGNDPCYLPVLGFIVLALCGKTADETGRQPHRDRSAAPVVRDLGDAHAAPEQPGRRCELLNIPSDHRTGLDQPAEPPGSV